MMDVTQLGKKGKFFVIAGPCVIEGENFVLETAEDHEIHHWKTRDSIGLQSLLRQGQPEFRRRLQGSWLEEGLDILARVKRSEGFPSLWMSMRSAEVGPASRVADVLQIPAFLSRQTSLLLDAATPGKSCERQKRPVYGPPRDGRTS